MSELVVAANRGPVSLSIDTQGAFAAHHASGGLAPSLAEALQGTDAAFVAAAMTEAERQAAREGWPEAVGLGYAVALVDVTPEVLASAYSVIANETLWFLYHGLFDRARRPVFDAAWYRAWEDYRVYSAAFATTIAANAGAGARIVVNDYHLALVGNELARLRPDLLTVHFSHTPFCSPEELGVLPDPIARELLGGLAAFGAIGFHTARWVEQYERCARAYAIDAPEVFSEPLGINVETLCALDERPSVERARAELRARVGARRLIVRSDRIEPSKNIVRGILAFEELLEREPEWQGEVVFVARAYLSRQDQIEYVAYRAEIERVVERVNARFRTPEYTPIIFEVGDDIEATVAALSLYDVLLVNPVRDGMNLVAKEGPVVNREQGALVLSTEAGAYEQLRPAVLAVSPFDVSGTATALSEALRLTGAARVERAQALRALAHPGTPAAWLAAVASRARQPAG